MLWTSGGCGDLAGRKEEGGATPWTFSYQTSDYVFPCLMFVSWLYSEKTWNFPASHFSHNVPLFGKFSNQVKKERFVFSLQFPSSFLGKWFMWLAWPGTGNSFMEMISLNLWSCFFFLLFFFHPFKSLSHQFYHQFSKKLKINK